METKAHLNSKQFETNIVNVLQQLRPQGSCFVVGFLFFNQYKFLTRFLRVFYILEDVCIFT